MLATTQQILKSTNAAATIVVTIASCLFVSRKIPIAPATRAAGKDKIISNAPSVARGLPQPGCKTRKTTTVARAIARKAADIFPKRTTVTPVIRQIYTTTIISKFNRHGQAKYRRDCRNSRGSGYQVWLSGAVSGGFFRYLVLPTLRVTPIWSK